MSNQFFNQSMPQTLVSAQLLCYISVFFAIINGGVVATTYGASILIVIGLLAGGLGIANERKYGYVVAVGASGLQVLMYLLVFGTDVFRFQVLLSFAFAVALFALLLHPQSRNHQKVWFH